MIKTLLFCCLFSLFLWATPTLGPVGSIEVNGTAKDMVLDGDHLVVATDMGHIEVHDIVKKEKIKEISIPDVKDFMGDIMPARVMSTDTIHGKYLLLSDSGKGGYSNLYIYDGNLAQLLSAEDKEAIIKARFIDETHILLGYLSNEVALLDITTKKERYKVQLSESKFSDFALNEDKSQAVFSCESGVLSVVDVQSGKLLKELKGQNVDNVYKVDFKHGMVSGAGQDQRASLYDVESGKGDYIKGHFLIYATALSPSAKKVAFAMDEKNNISIYNTSTKSKIALLKGQKSTLNVIIFKDENRIFSASDDNTVMVWDLNQK
ncbi:WD40 repeat domain-containing protein [Sulfurovum sp.]|uniref:WD40 repeat domain-containing protein n=1 Tax=Sulfurovum sp. TaxID=1969726 RepID=UPI0025D2B430|nr:WD40 repeat domain-containing protein [Sulfurovum sp.]